MNINSPRGLAAATLIAAALISTQSLATKGDKLAQDITHSMEKFYGKPISTVEDYLRQKFGVSSPIKTEGSRYTYMLPADKSNCGELTLDTNNNTVSSWQTIIWNRSEQHQRGRACEAAFQQKVSNR